MRKTIDGKKSEGLCLKSELRARKAVIYRLADRNSRARGEFWSKPRKMTIRYERISTIMINRDFKRNCTIWNFRVPQGVCSSIRRSLSRSIRISWRRWAHIIAYYAETLMRSKLLFVWSNCSRYKFSVRQSLHGAVFLHGDGAKVVQEDRYQVRFLSE